MNVNPSVMRLLLHPLEILHFSSSLIHKNKHTLASIAAPYAPLKPALDTIDWLRKEAKRAKSKNHPGAKLANNRPVVAHPVFKCNASNWCGGKQCTTEGLQMRDSGETNNTFGVMCLCVYFSVGCFWWRVHLCCNTICSVVLAGGDKGVHKPVYQTFSHAVT